MRGVRAPMHSAASTKSDSRVASVWARMKRAVPPQLTNDMAKIIRV